MNTKLYISNRILITAILLPFVFLWVPPLFWLLQQIFTSTIYWDWLRLFKVTFITVFQALVSAFFSILIAIPVAIALVRRNFRGKQAVNTILSICFILPPVIVVFAIIAMWGRSGTISTVLYYFGFPPLIAPFGWVGVILGHIFLNTPFAIRLFTIQLESQPNWIWQTSKELNLSPMTMLRFIDLQILSKNIFPVSRLIFLYCLHSFAIVWLLGGGPSLTTLEVALYSAIRQEADVNWAVQIIIIQMAIASLFILIPYKKSGVFSVLSSPSGLKVISRPDSKYLPCRIIDVIAISIIGILVVLPLFSLLFQFNDGYNSIITLLRSEVFYKSLAGSLTLSIPSAILGTIISFAFSYIIANPLRSSQKYLNQLPLLVFVIPFIALASSWVLLSLHFNLSNFTLLIVIIITLSIAVLPLGVTLLHPSVSHWHINIKPVINELNLTPFYVLKNIFPQYFLKPLFQLTVWGFAFSFGDLSLTALFGAEIIPSIPVLMHRLFGSYHTSEAQGLALLMLLLYFVLHFGLFSKKPSLNK